MSLERVSREALGRIAVLVFVSSCVLTLDFLGVLAVLDPSVTGIAGRVPFYLLAAALVFVAGVLYLESQSLPGSHVIVAAAGFGVVGFLVVSLAVEGILFSISRPEQVLTENLIVYFLSAGLICTGLGFWTLRHWREIVSGSRR